MKNKIFISSLFLVLVFVVSGCSLSSSVKNTATTSPTTSPAPVSTPEIKPATATITIENFAFSPATLTIKKGVTVTWTNNDQVPHQIYEVKSTIFNSNILNQGQNFSFTFNEVGGFDYSCSIHPAMTGRIIVE